MAYATEGMEVYWEYYDDKFFFNKEKTETIMIDFKNAEIVRLYNPNTSQYQQLTVSEFNDFSATKLIKARFLLGYTFINKGEIDLTGVFRASNNLKELIQVIATNSRINLSSGAWFSGCFIRDLTSKKDLFNENDLVGLNKQIEKLLKERKSFKPTTINIRNIFRKNNSKDKAQESQLKIIKR